MLRSYLILALRSLWRKRVYTLLNISGIAIGLTAVTLIYWQVVQIRSYDTQHPHADRLYRVCEREPASAQPWRTTVTPLLPTLLRENPAVEAGTRLIYWQDTWITYRNRDDEQSLFHADTSVFSVLHFPLKWGDPRTALATPNAMVISDKVADKLFPGENPLNKTVTLANGRAYVIRGVLAKRTTTSAMLIEVLLPIADLVNQQVDLTNWYSANCTTYLRLRPGGSDASVDPNTFAQTTRAFVQQHYSGEAKKRELSLLPISQMLRNEAGVLLTVILYGLGFIAGFLLLIVAINFLNLTSALSLARSGEVALRTTLGAATRQIQVQFVLEAVLVAGAGAVLGTLLLQALLPVYIDFFDVDHMFSPILPLSTALFLIGVVLLLGTVAGWLPGRYLTRQPLVTALQGRTTTTRTPFRSTLVVVQFALATVMIACTGVMMTQNRFIRQQQVGFDKSNLMAVELSRSYRNRTLAEPAVNNLINRLKQHPNVLALSTTAGMPGKAVQYSIDTYTSAKTNRDVSLHQHGVDETYLTTFGIPLVAGRGLIASDTIGENTLNVVVNEAATVALGYASPDKAVGQLVRPHGTATPYLIVGVFGNYYERGMQRDIEPMLFWSSGPARLQGNNWLVIKTKPNTAPALMAELEQQFAAIPARKPFRYVYLSEEYNRVYWVMEQSQTFLTGMAFVTVLLACAGVFGLSLFSIRQRTKEIGIRKVLGASVAGVVWLLSQRTLRLVAVGVLVAAPMAWGLMTQWLNTFAVHISFPWWVVAVSGTLALLVAWLTVSFQSVKAALTNPVDALRTD